MVGVFRRPGESAHLAPAPAAGVAVWRILAPVALAALALMVYATTLAPTITLLFGTGDSGELASTAYTLGIAHPTGYPLYTLIGHLVSHLGSDPARSMNMFSAVLGACAVGLLACLAMRIAADAAPRAAPPMIVAAAACVAIPFALSANFWTEAVATETRTLALALDGIVLALLIVPERPSARAACGAAGIYGLALSDHFLSLYLAPACVLLLIPWARLRPARWLSLAGCALLGLAPYLYLPIRAAQGPVANWGDPDSPARFLWVVTGQEYRYLMFRLDWPTFVRQVETYLSRLQHELSAVTLLMAVAGVVFLARRRPLVALALALTCAIDIAGTSNYRAEAAPQYLLLAAYCLCALAAAGWIGVASLIVHSVRRSVRAAPAAALVSLLCLGAALGADYAPASAARQDVRALGSTDVRAYGTSVLRSLPPRTILFASNIVFDGAFLETPMPLWYAQRALRIRPDVTIIAMGLLPYAWYYRQVRILPAFNQRFLPDSGESYDAGLDLALTQERMELLMRAARDDDPIFSVSPELLLYVACPRQSVYGRVFRLRCVRADGSVR